MNYQTVISSIELSSHLDDKDWAIVDCRFYFDDPEQGYKEFLEGHIPSSVYTNLDQDLSAPIIPGKTGRHPLPEVSKMVETISSWGIDRDTQVVIYDNETGAYAARLWWILRWLGHIHVAVLDGGLSAWVAEKRLLEINEITPEYKNFIPYIQSQYIVDAQFVDNIRDDSSYALLDARSLERYLGKNETIDPVAGHIPGAISAPYEENLTDEGFFKSKTELQERFRILLDDHDLNNTVVYCGSGVTAAHNIISMLRAGYDIMPKLYPGSWSDWITDPSRPIAK